MIDAGPHRERPDERRTGPPAGRRRGLKKGLYVIPSALTAANIAAGYYAVMSALRGFQLATAADVGARAPAALYFDYAALAIWWACLFDTLDGRIARLTKTTTEIGVHLDSLADVLTFGIAPAILVYTWSYGAALSENSNLHKLGWFLSFMYLMCGAFRLARFNVQATRPRVLAEGTTKVDKKNFIGLPIPMAAALIAAIIHFHPAPVIWAGEEVAVAGSALMMGLVATLAVLMVSTVRFSSFKTVGTGRRATRVAILVLAATGMLIWLYSRYVLLILAIAYTAHGPLLRVGALFRQHAKSEQKPDSLSPLNTP